MLDFANIPHELRALPAWLLWKGVPRTNGKIGKLPYYAGTKTPRGSHGTPEDIAQLATLDDAIKALKADPSFDGIGFATLAQFGIVALDADACIDDAGKIRPDVEELVDFTYAEISPSGRGIRAFFRGTAKDGKNTVDGFELFCNKNFVTVTGNVIDNLYHQAGERALQEINPPLQAALEALTRPTSKPKAKMQQPPVAAITAADEAPRADVIPDLKSALAALPDSFADSREQWINILLALASLKSTEYEADAYALALDFSQRSPKFDDDDFTYRWESADPTSVTYRTIFRLAAEHGWQNPRKGKRSERAQNIKGFTDTDHARRIVKYFGDAIRYVPDTEVWLNWTDKRWLIDSSHASIYRLVSVKLFDVLWKEALDAPPPSRDAYCSAARRMRNRRYIDDVQIMTAIQPELRVDSTALDADPFIVGFDGGRQIIDLRTGQPRDAAPADYVTKSVTPDCMGASVKAVRWRKFIADVLDPSVVDWFHRFCGYLLTGSTREHIFVFCYGVGANGKSVLAEVLKHVLGDYARTVATQTLTDVKRQGAGHSTDLVRLRGARLAIASETENGVPLAESFVKTITGGDTICARELNRPPIEFTPEFKLMLLGNHKPPIKNQDEGIWRRTRLIPFTRQFTGPDCNPNLAAELKEESPHILAWLVEGCLAWQRRGLDDTPALIVEQTAEYRRSEDVIGLFLEDCVISEPRSRTPVSDMYQCYTDWIHKNGYRKPETQAGFSAFLKKRNFENGRTKSGRYWQGVRLVDRDISELPDVASNVTPAFASLTGSR